MLSIQSFDAVSPPKDKLVKVKILQPFYVAGRIAEVGSIVSLALGDAQFMGRAISPPKCEIL